MTFCWPYWEVLPRQLPTGQGLPEMCAKLMSGKVHQTTPIRFHTDHT